MNADNRIPSSSPWGTVQYGSVLADGIITGSTARHCAGMTHYPTLARADPCLLSQVAAASFASVVGIPSIETLSF